MTSPTSVFASADLGAQIRNLQDCKVTRVIEVTQHWISAECSCGADVYVDRSEDGLPDLDTKPCAAELCDRRLCESARIRCDGCRRYFCASHTGIRSAEMTLCSGCWQEA